MVFLLSLGTFFLVERAIYGCQCAFSNFFELHNYDHIFDYSLVENRSFFLLLNQHMKNAFNRKCFQTALNLAKLIFRLCSIKDPMGILLIIDAIAIRARQFCFVIQAYETLEVFFSRFSLFINQFFIIN